MIPGDNAKTMKAFNDSIQSFTTGFKSYANKADQAGGAAIRRTQEALPGIAKKGIETAKLTGKDMNQAVFEGSPLGTAVGESAMSMGKSFLGMEDEKEDESTVISATDGAGESLNELNKLDDLKFISDKMSTLLNLVDSIEISVRDNNKLTEAQGKRAQRNRAKAEEAAREAAAEIVPADGEGGVTASTSGGGGILESLGGVFSSIPGMKTISGLFSGGLGGIAKIFGKLFWPITMIIGIVSFVTGFMEGYEEGGIIEGITQGFESLINNLIDVPLNFLKDVVAWIAGALGFEEVETLLNDFEFDISSMVRPVIDWFVELGEKISGAYTAAKDYVSDKFSGAMSFLGFGDDEEVVAGDKAPPKVTPKSAEEAPTAPQADDSFVDAPAPVPLYKRRKKYKDGSQVERSARTKKKGESGPTIERIRSRIASEGASSADEWRKGPERGESMNNLSKEESDALIARLLAEAELEDIPSTGALPDSFKPKDPRGAAAANIQNAGIESGAGGGGGGATVVIDQKDQSVSQAASNLLPMPMHTQTDPAMSQSAMVGDL